MNITKPDVDFESLIKKQVEAKKNETAKIKTGVRPRIKIKPIGNDGKLTMTFTKNMKYP